MTTLPISAACVAALTILTMTPGVDTMLTLRNAARGGFRDGCVTSLGICSGLFIHALISALGISVILVESARMFAIVKYAGAGYLIWLGASGLRGVFRTQSFFDPTRNNSPDGTGTRSGFSALRSLREGFLSNVLNPKTAIFYMAFLPQFISSDPAAPTALIQSLMIAGIHFAIAMIWQCGLALMVKQAAGFLSRPAVNRAFNGCAGGVLIFLGLRLATEHS